MAVSVENLVETRPVGEQERLFHYLHMMGGLLASGATRIRGPVTPELVQKAFDWLQRRHPILNSHMRYQGFAFRNVPPFIYPIPWFDTRGTAPIPVRVVTDPDPEAWRAVMAKENRTPIPVDKRKLPRVRIVLVRTHEDAEVHYLIFTMDHCTADAQAGLMMNDELFRYLADPEAMEAMPPVQIGLPPSLESGLPKKPDSGTRPYVPAVRFPKTPVPHPERASRSISRHIGANVAEAIRAAVRAHRTTMHGAIGASFLAATREKFGMNEMTILSTVELRRMMKPRLPLTAFGCYIDILRTHHELKDDFWAMAGDLSFKLISAIARDPESASILKLAGWDTYKHETIPTLRNHRRIDGIAITTAGESKFRGEYGPFQLEGVDQAMSIDMFGPSLFIVTMEPDGAIDLSVGYAADAMSREDVEDITDRAVAALVSAAEPATPATNAIGAK